MKERRAMTKHMTGTRKEWLAARLELLEAEKELTRRSDELARRRQELPWVRVDKEYRFETDEGSVSLADLFGGRSQLLVYHFMFGSDYNADFNVWFTEEQQRQGGIEYNYRHSAWQLPDRDHPVARVAAMCGTDAATFTRERPGMSAFVLEGGGVVYHT